MEQIDVSQIKATGTPSASTVLSGSATAGSGTWIGVSTVPTASTVAEWDANVNLSSNSFIAGFATTVTAAGTTTLLVNSPPIQLFTGSSAQTVLLPTTGVVAGQQFLVINKATGGSVTVQSSGANTITAIVNGGLWATFTAVVNTPTTAANWVTQYNGVFVSSGNFLNVLASGTACILTTAQTLTNKTISGASNTLTAIPLSALAGFGTSGNVMTDNGTGWVSSPPVIASYFNIDGGSATTTYTGDLRVDFGASS